jgi:hypothetical protein
MSAVSNSTYMSDAAILAWVTEQQQRLYGDLHSAMSFEESRADMASDVTDLKVLLQGAVDDKTKLAQLGVAIDHFNAKYGSVPEFAEVKEVVDDIQKGLAGGISRMTDYQTATQFASGAAMTAIAPGGGAVSGTTNVPAAAAPSQGIFTDPRNFVVVDKDQVDRWVKALGEKIDASNQNQQIGMIHIGEIKSTIDQGSNLASQLVKSGNDTTSSIINNF